ncbi:GNAT family N-acetyltransferase [Lacticaseibacillus saniviri]|uniref:N-acetyltransferase domain-containing protein n=1 Tax=Lacticaseibacillus saniviri JCM 17471 = DSM 24301 TaxID=1293598 RepID=A0A0R2MUL0_9LACO|nr:GNAT family N-acetyltransferase [Lacticaseibacillus saniviri]KRO16018.1 hypothetical protein IV56_GL002017 [Lacticaseibacillus saniviri JCM 17471 = DSM 24301]MCG4282840.1 GNAT family N-acetyltransferase [Lacticaseibacillus saniviri]
MSIRPATLVDLSAIVRLYQALTTEMAAIEPMIIQPLKTDNRDYFAKYIMDDNADILVSEEEGQVNGFALVVEAKTEAAAEIISYRLSLLVDLVVDANARNKGIGQRLLDEVTAWSKARELAFIQLNVLSANAGALRLYERNDFHSVYETMIKPL